MRVFVAGAAGAVGRQLVPILIAAGHDITGTTRSLDRARWLTQVGARPAVVDAYDADALSSAIVDAAPDVIVHQLTDLARGFSAEDVANTARLRRIATRTLVRAAVSTGASRIVAQSGAWLYADGPTPHDESHPLRKPTPDPKDTALRGIIDLELMVLETPGIEGLALRYGYLHGPGTAWTPEDAPEPHVGVEAAARATASAVERGPAGIYNVVDDGDEISNARAREILGWSP